MMNQTKLTSPQKKIDKYFNFLLFKLVIKTLLFNSDLFLEEQTLWLPKIFHEEFKNIELS